MGAPQGCAALAVPQEDSKPRGIVDLTAVQDVSDARGATGKANSLKLSTATGQVQPPVPWRSECFPAHLLPVVPPMLHCRAARSCGLAAKAPMLLPAAVMAC